MLFRVRSVSWQPHRLFRWNFIQWYSTIRRCVMHKNHNSASDNFGVISLWLFAMLFRVFSVSWKPLKLFKWNSIQLLFYHRCSFYGCLEKALSFACGEIIKAFLQWNGFMKTQVMDSLSTDNRGVHHTENPDLWFRLVLIDFLLLLLLLLFSTCDDVIPHSL